MDNSQIDPVHKCICYFNAYTGMVILLMGIYGFPNNTSKVSKCSLLGLCMYGVASYVRCWYDISNIDYITLVCQWIILIPLVGMLILVIPKTHIYIWHPVTMSVILGNIGISLYSQWTWSLYVHIIIIIFYLNKFNTLVLFHTSYQYQLVWNNGISYMYISWVGCMIIKYGLIPIFDVEYLYGIIHIIEGFAYLRIILLISQAYINNPNIICDNYIISKLVEIKSDSHLPGKQKVKSRQPFSLKSLIFSSVILIQLYLVWLDILPNWVPSTIALVYWIIDLIFNKRTWIDGYHHIICICAVSLVHMGHWTVDDFNLFLLFVIPDICLQIYLHCRAHHPKYGTLSGVVFGVTFIIVRTLIPVLYLLPGLYEKYHNILPFYPYHIEFHVLGNMFVLLFLHWSIDIVISIYKTFCRS
jgi:hypothetical protein